MPPIFNPIRYLPLAAGRWINDADEAQKRIVCVIGDEMLKNLSRASAGSAVPPFC